MIAQVKSFLKPQTSEEMRNRVIVVLIAALAVTFIGLAVSRWQQERGANYFTDGHIVLKLYANDRVTIYKVTR